MTDSFFEGDIMEWVKTFYAKQDAWGEGIYSRDVGQDDQQRAAKLVELAGDGLLRVLELGAGGGQTSAALADLGHQVTAVEMLPVALAKAQELAAVTRPGTMSVLAGDFYEIELADKFDVICYWDGFGVGSDADQRRLLQRIAGWLQPQGCAVIEVGTPWYWAKADGEGWQVGQAMRRYGFDPVECRLLDTWWPLDDESQAVTQSIRCYSPADFRLLLQGTGLDLQSIEPTGAVDYEAKTYRPQAPLQAAMGYIAKLILSEV
jgi:SAM-dependent methyltransferase